MANKALVSLTAVLSANNTKFKKGLSGAQASMKGFAKKINSIGGGLAPFVGITSGVYALQSVLRGAGRIIMDFEQSMANVRSITRATDEEFKKLSDSAKALGGSTKFTASEVAALQTEYGKLGFTTDEILKASEATLNFAAATNTELARAAEVAGSVLRGFGIDAGQTGRVVDVMARSFTMSALDTERFAEAMKYVAPVARQAGVSLEETTAMLAKLADVGIHGSMAGTGLRKIFLELTNDGKPLRDRIEELAESGITMADANDLVGERAQTALIVLKNVANELPAVTEALQNAGGAAEEMAEKQLNTLTGQLTILTSAYEGLILELSDGENAVGGVKEKISTVSKTLNVLTAALDKNEGKIDPLLKKWSHFAGVIGLNVAAYDLFSKAIGKADEKLKESDKAMSEVIQEGNIDLYKKDLGLLREEMDKAAKSSITLAQQLKFVNLTLYEGSAGELLLDAQKNFDDYTEAVKDNLREIQKWYDIDFSDGIDLMPEEFGPSVDEWQKLGRAINTSGVIMVDMKKDSEEVSNAFSGMSFGLGALSSQFINAFSGMRKSMVGFENSVAQLAETITRVMGKMLIMAGIEVIEKGKVGAGLMLIASGMTLAGLGALASANNYGDGKYRDQMPSNYPGANNMPQYGGSILYGNDIKTSNTYYTNLYNRVG